MRVLTAMDIRLQWSYTLVRSLFTAVMDISISLCIMARVQIAMSFSLGSCVVGTMATRKVNKSMYSICTN